MDSREYSRRFNASGWFNSVFQGRLRKPWSDLPLQIHGAAALSTDKIPGLNSVEIKELKLLPRNGNSGTWVCAGHRLSQLLARRKGFQYLFSDCTIYHVELELDLNTEKTPVCLYMSQPGIVVSDIELSGRSRGIVRTFLESNGFCSRSDVSPDPSLKSFFIWLARSEAPTMTERDFVSEISQPVFDLLRDKFIFRKYDYADYFLCNCPKNHRCSQYIVDNSGDPTFPFLARCDSYNEVVPIRKTDIQRYTTSRTELFGVLKKLFCIHDGDYLFEDIEGLHCLGNAIWRDKKTKVFFAYKTWLPDIPRFLYSRVNAHENTLVLSPARWTTSIDLQARHGPSSNVELLYLEDALEIRHGDFEINEKYDHVRDSDSGFWHLPYAVVFDQNGRREVTKKVYDRLLEQKSDYDLFLNCKKLFSGGYEGGRITDNGYESLKMTDFTAPIIAKLIINRGVLLGPKKLCPANFSGERKKRGVEEARKDIDIQLIASQGRRAAVWKFINTRLGNFIFEPPSDSKYLLLLPMTYENDFIN